jgi:hypothetical protein
VDGVLLDAGSPLLADGALFGIGRIGGTHQLAVVGDGVFLLEAHDDDRAAGHEVGERVEEGLVGVDRVEALGLALGEVQHLNAEDAEVVVQQGANDVALGVLLYGVGLDDGKSALQCLHAFSVLKG